MIDCILAIDQGTSSTKVLLVDGDSGILARGTRAVALSHPNIGWAEQSADEIWDSVCGAVADALAAYPACRIAGIGISNQRETIVLWDRSTGTPVAPAIIWQCRRTSDRCAALRAGGHAGTITRHTGLGIDPLFPASKLEWLLDDERDDDWREPWQQQPRSQRRRPLEAISRRGQRQSQPQLQPQIRPQSVVPLPPQPSPGPESEDWPDDAAFSVSRWQRQQPSAQRVQPPQAPTQPPSAQRPDQGSARPLPRSTRRR